MVYTIFGSCRILSSNSMTPYMVSEPEALLRFSSSLRYVLGVPQRPCAIRQVYHLFCECLAANLEGGVLPEVYLSQTHPVTTSSGFAHPIRVSSTFSDSS